jgi:hypothetical protein
MYAAGVLPAQGWGASGELIIHKKAWAITRQGMGSYRVGQGLLHRPGARSSELPSSTLGSALALFLVLRELDLKHNATTVLPVPLGAMRIAEAILART